MGNCASKLTLGRKISKLTFRRRKSSARLASDEPGEPSTITDDHISSSEPKSTVEPKPLRTRFYRDLPIEETVAYMWGISQQCLYLAKYLRDVDSLPTFLGALDGSSELDKGVPWPSEEYQQAFKVLKSSSYHDYVIAAWLAKWVWECIIDDSLFTPEAAADLNHISSLPIYEDGPRFDKAKFDEAVYFERILRKHGAEGDSSCQPGTPEFAHLQEHFIVPIKTAFMEHLPSIGCSPFDSFAQYIWRYAIRLRNQKLTFKASFHPSRTDTLYHRCKNNPADVLLYYDGKSKRGVTPSHAKLKEIPTAGPGVVLWYPEVMIQYPMEAIIPNQPANLIFEASYITPTST